MTAVVEIERLSKTYGSLRAVDSVSLTVGSGEIYGFLGPNGAGKTTTLRMVLGLIAPTDGRVTVLGARPGSRDALGRTGALIEGPACYPYLSGRDNLRVLARYCGVESSAIDRVLSLVDLTDRAADRFASYSLGMKQRLGVAAALLKDPDLVVLDEPTNGLDPAGMRDMRQLILRLGAEGRTVVLSSHLMAEVQQICDRVAVIDKGRVLVESSIRELRGDGELVIGAAPSDLAQRVLNERRDVRSLRVTDQGLRVQVDTRHTADIARSLVAAGVALTELRYEERQLEDIFMALTGALDEGTPRSSGDTGRATNIEGMQHV